MLLLLETDDYVITALPQPLGQTLFAGGPPSEEPPAKGDEDHGILSKDLLESFAGIAAETDLEVRAELLRKRGDLLAQHRSRNWGGFQLEGKRHHLGANDTDQGLETGGQATGSRQRGAGQTGAGERDYDVEGRRPGLDLRRPIGSIYIRLHCDGPDL